MSETRVGVRSKQVTLTYEELRDEYNSVLSKYDALRRKNTEFEDLERRLRNFEFNLSNHSTEFTKELLALQLKYKIVISKCQELWEKNCDLNEELLRDKQQIENLNSDLKKLLTKTCGDSHAMEKTHKSVLSERDQLRTASEVLKNQVDQLQSTVSSLRDELNTKNMEFLRMREEYTKATSVDQELRNNIERLQKIIDQHFKVEADMKNKLDVNTKKLEEVEKDSTNAHRDNEDFKIQIEQLKLALELNIDMAHQCKQESISKDEKVRQMEKMYKAMSEEIKESRLKMESFTYQLGKWQYECTKTQEENDALQTAHRISKESLYTKIDKLRAQLETEQEKVRAAEQEIQTLRGLRVDPRDD
ncbi:uncharacterized protein LOC135848365 [Planococcus citri]|uniref:uncharacterized protein LOC135848365 n=1 Tax=Planococcus citri TaxID=170843 RepID=UPI0031F97D72